MYLLDTSAVLAHFFAEPGGGEVAALLKDGKDSVALAAPSWVELDRKLGALIPDAAEAERVFRHYTRSLCALVPLDAAATLAAIRIHRASPIRLPMVDALIAGCAAAAGLTLVHRDSHMDAIPAGELKMLRLPDKWTV
ncbi:MAG: PIN domain-containing protein [Verrucomicrobiota bacterium]